MKTYIVGIISFFDNELNLIKVKSEDEVAAIKEAYIQFSNKYYPDSIEHTKQFLESDHYPSDIEGIKDYFYNCDMAIEITEV